MQKLKIRRSFSTRKFKSCEQNISSSGIEEITEEHYIFWLLVENDIFHTIIVKFRQKKNAITAWKILNEVKNSNEIDGNGSRNRK